MMKLSWHSSDDEKRKLRIHLEVVKRSLITQQKKRKLLEENIKQLAKENKQLKEENKKLHRQMEMYKGMVFKENKKSEPQEGKRESFPYEFPKKHRGGQIGHVGYGRKNPKKIDHRKRVYTNHCPDCDSKIQRSKTFDTHTVTDIPPLEHLHSIVTKYEIERQWCSVCKKEVRAKPFELIPNSRFGINLLIYIMILKYGLRATLDSIVFSIYVSYGIKISKGGIIEFLHRARAWLEENYEIIKKKIKVAKIKHADETGWRIDGINTWIWAFLTKKEVCYTAEESRGKGVSEEFFEDSPIESILVRDDYGAYKSLRMQHQSCWGHLLRKSYEEANAENSSEEVKILHKKLSKMYEELTKVIESPFNKKEREEIYNRYWKELQNIMNTKYRYEDTRRIRERIRNQGKNLLTAVLYEDVPLTNNLAERTIRPLVVTRKISGGSRSIEGAKTHVRNMSIFQTIRMRKLEIISTLKRYLLKGIGKFDKNNIKPP